MYLGWQHRRAGRAAVPAPPSQFAVARSVISLPPWRHAGGTQHPARRVRALLAKDHGAAAPTITPQPLRRIFWQGATAYLLNPKTAIFFLAFLPQFTDPARGPLAGQLLLLGALFVALAICSDGLYALSAGALGGVLRASVRFRRGQWYISGGVYLALDVVAATSGGKGK